jgi:Tol biopolymer transport system component
LNDLHGTQVASGLLWNPEGTHLAVHAGGGIYTIQISSLSPARYDSSSITLLTSFNASAFFPTWSEDGQWIAFDTNYLSEDGGYSIWKIKSSGTDLTFMVKGRIPHWAPTEKWLLLPLCMERYINTMNKNNKTQG